MALKILEKGVRSRRVMLSLIEGYIKNNMSTISYISFNSENTLAPIFALSSEPSSLKFQTRIENLESMSNWLSDLTSLQSNHGENNEKRIGDEDVIPEQISEAHPMCSEKLLRLMLTLVLYEAYLILERQLP
jgi:hypothetical protein